MNAKQLPNIVCDFPAAPEPGRQVDDAHLRLQQDEFNRLLAQCQARRMTWNLYEWDYGTADMPSTWTLSETDAVAFDGVDDDDVASTSAASDDWTDGGDPFGSANGPFDWANDPGPAAGPSAERRATQEDEEAEDDDLSGIEAWSAYGDINQVHDLLAQCLHVPGLGAIVTDQMQKCYVYGKLIRDGQRTLLPSSRTTLHSMARASWEIPAGLSVCSRA